MFPTRNLIAKVFAVKDAELQIHQYELKDAGPLAFADPGINRASGIGTDSALGAIFEMALPSLTLEGH